MWKFQGLIKNEVKFPGMTKKKSCGISRGSWFLALEFQRDITQFCGISSGDGDLVVSGISRGNEKNNPGGGGASKKYVLNLPCLIFFWNSPIVDDCIAVFGWILPYNYIIMIMYLYTTSLLIDS